VAVVEKNAAVAVRRIGRLQDREISGEMDEPLGVDRRLVDVGDALLRRRMRIDRKMRPPDETLICADSAELVPTRKRNPLDNRQFYPIRHNPTSSTLLSSRSRERRKTLIPPQLPE